MIKLQDFARECGVTDRAIQKHLVKYADELDGLYQRKGPNGTWLTEEACEILRSKMKQQPLVLGDAQTKADFEEVKKKYEQLLERHAALSERHALLSDWKAEKAQQIADAENTQRLLVASEEEKKQLEAKIEEIGAENAALSDEKAKAEEKTQEASEAAQRAQDELTAAQERERELREYLGALEAWSALGLWKRTNKKKYPKPTAPEWLKEEKL